MASRRRKRDDEGGSLDSLMDALTNVVAVLILILILLQADVRQAVEKIVESLKPVSVEQLQQARDKRQEMEKTIAAREQQRQAPAPAPAEIAKMKADLALLEKASAREEKLLIELKKLQQTAELTAQKAKAEKEKTDAVLAEIARLEALLDRTPRPVPKRPTLVRLPNSREIPKNATIYYCYITGNQAHLIDPTATKATLMEAFERESRKLIRKRVKVKGALDRVIYDQEKTVAFFASKNWNVRNQKVSVPFNRPWTRLNFRIDFDPAKGDASLDDMNQPDGRFHRMMRLVRSYRDGVLMFRVRPDGFETYLKAREIADEMQMPCGWEIDGNKSYGETLEFEVNRLEEPPPPAAPQKDKPVPAPKRVLD